jgi:serine/threonine-protein kinase
VTTDGHLKVLDFGLARVRERPRSRVQSVRFGAVLGTPAYMAPEQARGDWKAVDERTDLWALGATLFTLLSGRFVHEGATKQAQIEAAVTARAPSLRERCPEVPEEFAAIIDRALAFESADRWPNASAMLEAVRAAQRAPASLARTTPVGLERPEPSDAMATLIQRRPSALHRVLLRHWPVAAFAVFLGALAVLLRALW